MGAQACQLLHGEDADQLIQQRCDLDVADMLAMPLDGADGREHDRRIACIGPGVQMGDDDMRGGGRGVGVLQIGEGSNQRPGFIRHAADNAGFIRMTGHVKAVVGENAHPVEVFHQRLLIQALIHQLLHLDLILFMPLIPLHGGTAHGIHKFHIGGQLFDGVIHQLDVGFHLGKHLFAQGDQRAVGVLMQQIHIVFVCINGIAQRDDHRQQGKQQDQFFVHPHGFVLRIPNALAWNQ